MTSWQDQQTRGGASSAADPSVAAAPGSRRAAREAERRAAEALAERQPHPSGVVDFDAHDFSSEFAPDQEFSVGDTQDIWAALTRGQRPTTQPTTDLGAFRSGRQEAPVVPQQDSVSGDMLDRVRDALLRREAPARPADQPPAAARPAAFPQPGVPQPASDEGLSRRRRREREAADQREDGLPGELFDARPAVGPQPAAQPSGFEGYDYEDDGYYDEPYQPEPTVAIPRQVTDLEAPSHTTNPISLPHAFSEPTGDDAITFSSPVQPAPADRRDDWAAARIDPAFIEPADRWEDDEDDQYEQGGYEPRAYTPGPLPAQPAFQEPEQYPAHFQSPQLGPPSEVTDLAGFEALIRKARQQPQPAEQVQQPGRPLAWADEDETQEGFTGLLSRSVGGSHGSANALILPNDPQPDMTQAVNANGDIFITGSMNLPRSLSTTGAHSDLYDSQDIDRLYEAAQDEPAAGVAPVRASKAVSGAPHERGFSSAPRRRGNVLPTVLAIVAGAMAVGVVTLLVGSWVLKLF
ncbi:hypothetical protein [Amnibacterium sp.]|uniref:hypothetical protein n=1 Tax=Amnibacterium sp. TaxID=1872496 RepID=UPI003F7CC61E